MKEVKIGGQFIGQGGQEVRVIDISKLETGERGILFVPAEATDQDIDTHAIQPATLRESEFNQVFAPTTLEDGDEVLVFGMGKNLGTVKVEATDDPNVMRLAKCDGMLVSKKVHPSGMLFPLYRPASQQARDFTISYLEEVMAERNKILEDMIVDAKNYIDNCLMQYKTVLTHSTADLKAVAEAQHRRLVRTMDQLVKC